MKLVKEKLNEYGPIKQKTELENFINDFINGLGNPIIMSMFYRMMDGNNYTKFGNTVYKFSPEELQKLEQIKPLFDNINNTITKIYNISKNK